MEGGEGVVLRIEVRYVSNTPRRLLDRNSTRARNIQIFTDNPHTNLSYECAAKEASHRPLYLDG